MSPRILVVEDEPDIAAIVVDYLRHAGYTVEHQAEGRAALASLITTPPDLTLLDIMLPGMEGLEILRQARRHTQHPIIMLTARVEEVDRLIGLELGADDYICKPFSPREVVARVKAVLRRARAADAPAAVAPADVAAPPLHLDESTFEARLHGTLLPLTPVEFRLLHALQLRPGRVMSRSQLIDASYLDHRVVSDRTVDSHIKNLRRKIADAGHAFDPIVSIYGMGYKLDWSQDRAAT